MAPSRHNQKPREVEEPAVPSAFPPGPAYIHTNVLAIPLAHVVMEAYTNEDWVDSLLYLIDLEGVPHQLDLRGITFEIMLRRRSADNEVIAGGSSLTGTLTVGAAPNVGHLIWFFPRETMRRLWPGQYVGDVLAKDQRLERTVLTVALTLTQGITRS